MILIILWYYYFINIKKSKKKHIYKNTKKLTSSTFSYKDSGAGNSINLELIQSYVVVINFNFMFFFLFIFGNLLIHLNFVYKC